MKELNFADKVGMTIAGGVILLGGYAIGRIQSQAGGQEPARTQRPPATENISTAAGIASSACKDEKLFTTAFIAQFPSAQDCQDFEDNVRAGKGSRLPAGIPTNNGFGGSPKVDGLNQ